MTLNPTLYVGATFFDLYVGMRVFILNVKVGIFVQSCTWKKIQPVNNYENIELPVENSREHFQELHP